MANNFPYQMNSQSNNSSMNQFFPQPQGNLYLINNSLEVANIPAGMQLSAILCMSEGLLYLKAIQNGSPVFLTYKLTSNDQISNNQNMQQNRQNNQNIQGNGIDLILPEIEKLNARVEKIENQLLITKNNHTQFSEKNSSGGKIDELI